ncbi:MAG: hypothetical protein HEEMFOPI_01730 [Holosporales bacterium]
MIKKILALIFLIKNVAASECAIEHFSDEESLGTFFSICACAMHETSLSTRSSLDSEEDDDDIDQVSPMFDMISLDVIRDCMPGKYTELMPQIQYAYDDVLHKISKQTTNYILPLKNILTQIVLFKTLKHECSRLLAYLENGLDDADYILMEIEFRKKHFQAEEIKILEEKLTNDIHIYSILYNLIQKKVFILYEERKIRNHSRMLTKGLRLSTIWTTRHVFNSVLGAPLIEHIAKISENKNICQSLKEWLIILCNHIITEAPDHYKRSVFWRNEDLFKNHFIFHDLFDSLNRYRIHQIKARFDRALNVCKQEMKPQIIKPNPSIQKGHLAAAIQWYHTLPHRRKMLIGLMLVSDIQRLENIIELYDHRKLI